MLIKRRGIKLEVGKPVRVWTDVPKVEPKVEPKQVPLPLPSKEPEKEPVGV